MNYFIIITYRYMIRLRNVMMRIGYADRRVAITTITIQAV